MGWSGGGWSENPPKRRTNVPQIPKLDGFTSQFNPISPKKYKKSGLKWILVVESGWLGIYNTTIRKGGDPYGHESADRRIFTYHGR